MCASVLLNSVPGYWLVHVRVPADRVLHSEQRRLGATYNYVIVYIGRYRGLPGSGQGQVTDGK